MGFFSWTCAKTNLPVMASTSWGDRPDMCKATLLRKDGNGRLSVIHGTYDGYGRLDDLSFVDGPIYDELEGGKAKLVLTKFYDPATDTFDALGRSRNDPGQGHFHDSKMLDAAFAKGGFPSYRSYVMAYNDELPLDLALALDEAQIDGLANRVKAVKAAIGEQRRAAIPGGGPDFEPTRFVRISYGIKPELGGLVMTFGEKGPTIPVGSHSPEEIAKLAIAASGDPSPLAFPLPDGRDVLCFESGLGESWYLAPEKDGVRSAHAWPHEVIAASGFSGNEAERLKNDLIAANRPADPDDADEEPGYVP